ncbi:Rho GTPase activating protein [Parasponia andersonii]|uniref:Rho GTPase activating protein n=1 Tax=Parasponia andersonii TaxID=3476 RepID=A0A2P5CR23_PARAD|nr:Rho GTPase activating protein [Parasponia andersonii]
MTTRNAEPPPQGDKVVPPAPPPPLPSPAEQLRTRVCNTVFKSGPLFISSKGIGWTSWKKRWFILTRTSLVFFRSDPSAVPQKGSEVNLTLGGIDLNNSGSVVVKTDKKLLTVLFSDGRDGRAFTLKAETLEDLNEWKTALESALAQAPSAAHATGPNGIFRNDQIDSVDGSLDQSIDKQPIKSSVIGRPILLALEDVDGTPSFLEKALQFIEEHGVKVEGILRQAADVDDVEHRVREYEQGKNEFSPGEDAHIVADCIKHVLRELPSSPVPASCCNALLQACRTERSLRVNAMRSAICEAFPEPNRHLLQRILMMMRKVASQKAVNRMSCPAVAACMAPLLLRPLLAGDCEIENDFDMGGDGSVQLLQAAAAANHAQAIVITLLDEYDKIFGEDSVSPEPYTDSEESGSESEEATDDDESYEDEDNDDAAQESDAGTDDDPENASSETCSESGDSGDDVLYDNKECADSSSGPDSSEVGDDSKSKQNLSSSFLETSPPQPDSQHNENELTKNSNSSVVLADDSAEVVRDISSKTSAAQTSTDYGLPSCIQKSTTISNLPGHSARNRSAWGRTPGRKNLSMESINYGIEDEVEIQRLEVTKSELEHKITEEVKQNAVLQTNLKRRKTDLQQRRLALEQDLARLQEQLQKERDLRMALEAGLRMSHGPLPYLASIDEKTKAELEDIAIAEEDVVNLTQKLDELGMQLNQQRELNYGAMPKAGIMPQKSWDCQTKFRRFHLTVDCDTELALPIATLEHFIIEYPNLDESYAMMRSGHHKSKFSYENMLIQLVGIDQASRVSRMKFDALDTHLVAAENENERRYQNQQRDLCSTNYRSVAMLADPSTADSVASRHNVPANSKSNGAKGEGTNSTTSALTKLTTRLNFMKERRSQIAMELHNMDKGPGSSQIVQNLEKGRELLQNPDKSQGSEVEAIQNPERSRELDSSELFQKLDRGMGTEIQSFQNPEKLKKAESQSLNYADRGKRSDSQNTHGLDRGKSENHVSLNVDKGRVLEGQSFISSRASSR